MSKNFDVRAAICHRAENFFSVGEIFDERTESDALNYPENFYVEQNDSPRDDFSKKISAFRRENFSHAFNHAKNILKDRGKIIVALDAARL